MVTRRGRRPASFVANTHAYILIFTDRGRCYWLRLRRARSESQQQRQGDRESVHMVQVRRSWRSWGAGIPEQDGCASSMGPKKGTIKKTDLKAFSNPRSAGIIAIQIDDDDVDRGRRNGREEGSVIDRATACY
jgi:DNA gyrase subunit A